MRWPTWLVRKPNDNPIAGLPIELIPADIPITHAEQDLLGRATIARRISEILSAPGSKEGRVFAIRGAWGEGKSSLKNLVIEELGEQVPVLDFNPWQWGDSQAIAKALFTQLAGKLGGAHGPDAAKRAAALRRYGGYFTVGIKPLDKFGQDVPAITSLLAVAAIASGVLGVGWPGIQAKTVGIAAVALAIFAWVIGATLNRLGRDRSVDDLDTVRTSIQELLGALKRPLVVFVDDIDRLEPEQIRTMIRQIKANASLPNINFVLLFQPSIVEQALEPVSAGEGRSYLEKIIQANFDLPPLAPEKLSYIFAQQLGDIVNEYAIPENGFDQTRWGNMLLGGILPFVRNLRDAKRLLSSIAIHIEMHKGEHAFEVNLIDFLVLETLRVFEPNLHRAISENKALLTQSGRFSGDNRQQADREAIDRLLPEIGESRMTASREIIKGLFPPIEWALGGTNYSDGEWVREWMDAKRVCTKRGFDRYFELQQPSGTMSESDFVQLMHASEDPTQFLAAFHNLVDRDLRAALAHRLDESVKRLPLDHPERWLALIFENGEALGKASQGPFNDAFVASWRSAIWYLRRLGSSAASLRAFNNAQATMNMLAVSGFVLSLDDDARTKPDSRYEPVFELSDWESAKETWLTNMEAFSENVGAMLGANDLVSRLYRWKQFGGDDAPRDWAKRVAEMPEHMPTLLARFVNVGTRQSWGDRVATKTETFHREHFDDFLPIEVVQASLAKIDAAKLSSEESRIVALFNRHAEDWSMQGSDRGSEESQSE
ncbi:MAG: P-loop NTPase fold protein [Pseudomonadota bacterium]